MSQQNVQVASTLQQEESCTEGQTNANSNNEGKGKDPKSQMAFIALAIMSHPEYKMTLSEIYHHIENKHPRYLRRPDWRNGVRHTLSHNACFIKVEKAVHRPRKGHYWSIHPACIQEFSEGKFCLRRSKRLIMAYTNPSFPSEVPQLDVLKDFNEANVE
ncbi:hypothetical protein FSP39_006210 [Pinctada imbricata]|uniref:Fork-head domain-containing protein n=1 Tax=Pinctada imbricata TaxID=66713 RepID=A0AA88YAL4_PINIB|nr:hypothetical protein FSP39_006210 [Pinctada imbricata]